MKQEHQRVKVLILESRPDVRSALRLFLEQDFENITVTEVSKTSDLLAQVAIYCPDLLLLDWEMPDLKPAEILARLRNRCPQLKVIVSSGRSEVRQNTIKAGADAFISKSERPEQILETIKQLLH